MLSDSSERKEKEREAELVLLLEKSIRDSEALDTESLCIVAGQKVWAIHCNVKVLNDRGNLKYITLS